jgi:DNA invertase Pin-like site-specific DNA recombinase
MHILGAIAEFERARIAERVKVGMRRAKSEGRRVGRRRRDVSEGEIAAVSHLSLRQAANALGVSKSFLHAWRLSRRVI